MYQNHYGFTRMPFTKDLPPNDLFAPVALQELASRLTFLTRERGLGLLTGEIGSGKSTAVRRFVDSLDPNQFLVVYLPNPTIGISGLYRDLLTALAYEPPHSRPKMVTRIRSAFQDLLQNKHRCPVIIIDEAHHLPPRLSSNSACCSRLRWTANLWERCCWLATLNCVTPCAFPSTNPFPSVFPLATT